MQAFTKLTAAAAPFDQANIDTNQLCPTRFNKVPLGAPEYPRILFHDQRFNPDGSEKPEFVLNQEPYRKAQIIVAGDNFGCGSSREHAPWALLDFGIRCVISTSFADIFYHNSFKNGILPIKVSKQELDQLMDDAGRGANATLTVDLEAQEIHRPDGGVIKFDIDPFKRHCLIHGLDDIGLTMEKAAHIDDFEEKAAAERPWV